MKNRINLVAAALLILNIASVIWVSLLPGDDTISRNMLSVTEATLSREGVPQAEHDAAVKCLAIEAHNYVQRYNDYRRASTCFVVVLVLDVAFILMATTLIRMAVTPAKTGGEMPGR